MIPPEQLVLLDTNVLLHLVRGGARARWIDQQYQLRARGDRPLVSAISSGELLRIGSRLRARWGTTKHHALDRLRNDFVVVDINRAPILTRYGELGAHLDDSGQPLPPDDVWIAATAAETGAVLLTTDSDFDRLHPQFITREYIDPEILRRL